MKLYRIILSLLFFCLFFTSYQSLTSDYVFAQEKNIFGVHLADTQDIHHVKDVVNSGGGDWGWVTIVIRTDQLNPQMWQEFFDNCRKYHLIPIIRLATIMDQDNWKRPSTNDVDNLANFLNSLNWPSRVRHLIVFNEINHGQEWGGKVDIKTFTDISIYTYQKFKSLNSDFYILSGALDLAAPEKPPQFKSAEAVYREIYNYKPEYFKNLDGLASHSYPNHGFIGLPTDQGQHSIHGFLWEQSFINSLGVSSTFPIFITETGWPHREGEKNANQYYTTKTTANLLLTAYSQWQNYPQIKAITPFIYNFPYQPFDHFSWLDKQGILYPEYQKLIDLSKSKNKPEQINNFQFVNLSLPLVIFNHQEYHGNLILKNTGQSIWGETPYCLESDSSEGIEIEKVCFDHNLVYPNQIKILNFKFKINSDLAKTPGHIGWQGIPPTKISAFGGISTIYRPHLSLKSIYYNLIYNIFD